MRLRLNEPGLRESRPGAQYAGAKVARWSDAAEGLTQEVCARRGIEALAGLVISRDAFEIGGYADEMFCTCVELYHADTDTDGEVADYIGVYFRVVEFRDGTYPTVGERSFKMLMQPLSDGNVLARWNAIDGEEEEAGGPDDAGGTMSDDVSTRIGVGAPLELGDIPEQDEGDGGLPSFLLLRDPGAGWQVWRRFAPEAKQRDASSGNEYRHETYTMVFPLLDSNFNWRFRVYDVPGGGLRVEMDQGNRS